MEGVKQPLLDYRSVVLWLIQLEEEKKRDSYLPRSAMAFTSTWEEAKSMLTIQNVECIHFILQSSDTRAPSKEQNDREKSLNLVKPVI